MSERRVSVRLVSVGGDQLKSLMTEVGDRGEEAMRSISGAAGPASSSLQEVDRAAQAAGVEMKALYERTALANAVMRSAAHGADNLGDRLRAAGMEGRNFKTMADEAAAYGRVLDNLRAKHNPLYAVIRQYKGTVAELKQAHAAGAISVDEMTAAMQRERQAALASIDALKGRNRQVDDVSRGAGMATHRMQNLSFQVQDIGVSLAGGMNPFTVMAQQGSQIAQIYGFGGGGVNALMRDLRGIFSLLGRSVLGVARAFPAATAALAVFTLGFVGLQHEINETSDVAVSLGDTVWAVFQTIGDGAKWLGGVIWDFIKPAVDQIAEWFWEAWDEVVAGFKWVGNTLINGVRVAVEGIRAAVDVIPSLFQVAWEGAKAEVFYALADMASGVSGFLQGVADGLNSVFGTNLSAPAGLAGINTDMNRMGNDASVAKQAGQKAMDAAWGGFTGRAVEIMASDPMGDLFDRIAGHARENARNRLAEEDEGGGAGGGGGGRGAAEEVADAAEEAATGWKAVAEALAAYAKEAQDWGTAVGSALTSAFGSAENAFSDFVTKGKVDFKELATSIIGDMAKIAARQFILGPIANLMSGWAGSIGPALSSLLPSFDGGGYTGSGARSGGLDGQGGFLAMMHPRERVYDEHRGMGGAVNVTIQTQDVNSFRRSRAQVAADIQRAVARGRRSM